MKALQARPDAIADKIIDEWSSSQAGQAAAVSDDMYKPVGRLFRRLHESSRALSRARIVKALTAADTQTESAAWFEQAFRCTHLLDRHARASRCCRAREPAGTSPGRSR